MTRPPSAPAVRLAQVGSEAAHPPPVDQDGPEDPNTKPTPSRNRPPTERLGRPTVGPRSEGASGPPSFVGVDVLDDGDDEGGELPYGMVTPDGGNRLNSAGDPCPSFRHRPRY